jgi:hypothetical protein
MEFAASSVKRISAYWDGVGFGFAGQQALKIRVKQAAQKVARTVYPQKFVGSKKNIQSRQSDGQGEEEEGQRN